MGDIINFLDKRASSKYGRNPLEPRLSVPQGVLASRILIDEGQEITGSIVNLSAGGLALVVDSFEYDLERGTEIERVTIETGDGTIFETKGLITHITPESGESVFSHRLGLGFERKESPSLDKLVISKSDRMFDILSKEEEMTRIFEDLVLIGDDARIGVKLDAHRNIYGRFNKKSQLIKISSFNLDFDDETNCMAFEADKEFTFFFSLFRSFYLFKSRVLTNTGKSIELEIPDFFVKLMRRNTSRIKLDGSEPVIVTIKHPYGKDKELKKAVTDMNEQGFSLELEEKDSIFPVGISLREIVIEIPGKSPLKTFGRLVHVNPSGTQGTYKCGIKFFEPDEEKKRTISEYVFFKRFPLLYPAGKEDYDKLWELFEKSGYLDEKPRESFELVREESNPAWEKLDASRGVLARNVTATDGEKITGGMFLSKVYNKSWLLHHFCILPGYQRTVTTSVYGGMIDQLLESGANYIVCYYNADKSWNQKNYNDFINEYPYKDENYIKTYDLFEFDLTRQEIAEFDKERDCNFAINDANDFDVKGIARFFEMNRRNIQIDAMDLSHDSLKLEKLGGEYCSQGLTRARKFFTAKRGKEMIGFALLDVTSTGVNIYALMDSLRIYLIDPNDPDKESISKELIHASLRYFKSIGKKTVLYYSNDKDISHLAPLRFQRLCTIVLWIAHRNCFARYSEYNGALFGRILARRKKIRDKAQGQNTDEQT